MQTYSRRNLIKRFLSRLGEYRSALAGMLVCMTAAAILEPLLALMLKPLLDGSGDFLVSRENIPYFAAAVLILLPLAMYGRAYLGGWLDITMQRDLRREMAAKLVRRPQSDSEKTGKTTTRFVAFVPAMTGASLPILTALVQEPLKTLFYLAQMFYLEWQLALILCLAMPPTAMLIRYSARRMKKKAERAQEEMAQMQSRLNESIALMPMIKVHGAGAARDILGRAFSSLRAALLRMQIVIAAGQPLSMILISVPSVVVLFYVSDALTADEMTAGDVAAFLGCMLLMPRSVRAITRSATLLEGMLAAAREVFGFLDSPEEENRGTKIIKRARGEIVFDNVYVKYPGAADFAVCGVSAKIAAGETAALVGRSGAGKTTLANLPPRFYSPQKGKVLLDGTDIRELTLESLRKQIALVTQDTLLFDDSVAANVCWPETPTSQNRARIEDALRCAAAEDFVAALPRGAESPAGENGGLFSGGQRQRIALARAFYRDAPIVILDEATSALDAETENKIRAAMQKLLTGRTALVIAHRFAAIGFADRALVLDGGRLIANDSPNNLLRDCPLYAELYRAQNAPH